MVKNINITVGATGEVLEVNASTPQEILESWLLASSYIDAWTKVKDRLKKVIPEFIDDKGHCEVGDYMFSVTATQRMNYDKSIMRQVFDEDTMDLFLEPAKGKIDKYIKEHLNELGEKSTLLRGSMIPVGRPYSTVRADRIR